MNGKNKLIATEEHFSPPEYILDLEAQTEGKTEAEVAKIRLESAREFGETRVAEMDAAGIDVQVLMVSTVRMKRLNGESEVKFCSETNKYLHEIIKSFPGRFEGFAVVPASVPEAAADETSIAISEYGFKGIMLSGNIDGRYLDDPFFDPIFNLVYSINVPIYLHPHPPARNVYDILFDGNYSPEVGDILSRHGWGWHIETSLNLIRIILSGVFDRYPKLQIIVGHFGETLSFMLPRLERRMGREITKLERQISEYLRENVYYTFGGFNFLPNFLNLFLQVGADRILFSTDYPYSGMLEAAEFAHSLPICDTDKRRIAYENAAKLLNIS
jgi:predicted TIM-barrel fold metal-dependent hydrolase